ncbi:hypothetical protein QAD02_006291 [Eretmocerus hayati]|uniref:Uncharacterized protein n=1 Tax=Eretmocerus hayati TaxID=131215 RepID=A0ACC2N0I6_9HYME|nr:hypothetical protein QAD02_006291 [Eretmocerus hayati]
MRYSRFTLSIVFTTIFTLTRGEVQNDTKSIRKVSRHRRIANGFPTDRYHYPYIVSIQNIYGSHGCAGSIISEKFILTAGHCADRPDAPSMVIMVGEPFQNDYPNQYYPVEEVFRHESYGLPGDLADAINDISLVKLKEPIKFSRIAQKVKLIRRDQYVVIGANAVALGWGAVREPQNDNDYTYNPAIDTQDSPLVFDRYRFDNGSSADARVFPKNLQCVSQTVISREECLARYQDPVHESHMCTFLPGRGPCFKDSGGPLIVDGILVGVLSGGKRCETYPGYPSLWTNVALFRDWIDSKMRDSVSHPREAKPPPRTVTNNHVTSSSWAFSHHYFEQRDHTWSG